MANSNPSLESSAESSAKATAKATAHVIDVSADDFEREDRLYR